MDDIMGNLFSPQTNSGFQEQTAFAVSPPMPEVTQTDTDTSVMEDDDFSFEGYQVVRKEFFSHKFDPQLTIKDNSITFNNACIVKLEKVVYIQFLINPETKQLVIRPCSEEAKDAVRWCIVKEDKRKSREISCGMFMEKLRDMMGWERIYRYKMIGIIKQKSGQQFFLFDLPSREMYVPQTKTGTKQKTSRAYYPEDWRDSFGLPMAEHEQSTEFDLSNGFESIDISHVALAAEQTEITQEV